MNGIRKEMIILGRIVRVTPSEIEYEADPKHRRLVLEHFGAKPGSKRINNNGDKEDKEQPGDEVSIRGVVATLNFLS